MKFPKAFREMVMAIPVLAAIYALEVLLQPEGRYAHGVVVALGAAIGILGFRAVFPK